MGNILSYRGNKQLCQYHHLFYQPRLHLLFDDDMSLLAAFLLLSGKARTRLCSTKGLLMDYFNVIQVICYLGVHVLFAQRTKDLFMQSYGLWILIANIVWFCLEHSIQRLNNTMAFNLIKRPQYKVFEVNAYHTYDIVYLAVTLFINDRHTLAYEATNSPKGIWFIHL